ncbi:MAG: 4Fe-4S ferredoxin [bacterium]|nr:4Fe-4S ferredoxin [bacterium]
MAVRDIIEIDEELCDGCGDCVSSCAEGAIQMIDGKAKLVSDVYCDGLGACLGFCPQGALTVIKRDSEEFDQAAVDVHLSKIATSEAPAPQTPLPTMHPAPTSGCPGSRATAFAAPDEADEVAGPQPSRLGHWPIQLHLVPPTGPFFQGADVLLAADCAAFAVGGFHEKFLKGRSLAIACPKLDSQQEIYLEKLVAMIDQAKIESLTVVIMEVPCCGGLMQLAQAAAERAQRSIPIRAVVVGVRGDVLVDRQVAGDVPPMAAGCSH